MESAISQNSKREKLSQNWKLKNNFSMPRITMIHLRSYMNKITFSKIINPRSDNKAIKLVALLSSPGKKR